MSGSECEFLLSTEGYSNDINCLSLISVGQNIFARSARSSTSETVLLPQLHELPISRRDNPKSCLSRRISLAFSMSSLLIFWPPFRILLKGYQSFDILDKVSGCYRNAVRIIPLRCPDVSGISVRMRPKYAVICQPPMTSSTILKNYAG